MLGVLAIPAVMDAAATSTVAASTVHVDPGVVAPHRAVERVELVSVRLAGADTAVAPAALVAEVAAAAAPPEPEPALVAAPVPAPSPVVAQVRTAPPAPAPAPAPPPPPPAPAPAPAPEPEPAPAASGSSLGSFTVTCYAIHGRTATGEPTHSGGVAVDPRVIPYGTRIEIEGVGVRVANDTGPRLRGNRLDVWAPSRSACMSFGRQVLDVRLAA